MVYDKNVAMELHSFLSRWGLLGGGGKKCGV